ncbi:MAG TPA: PilZ domain-containing protein [Tepidisphaeraceae bacterium]|nr:PilZ domain-containing protein [Tepidisphaeraceae bacterium]
MMSLVSDASFSEMEDIVTMPERRRGLRIQQNRPVKIYAPCIGRYFGGQTHDISSTGLRIELPLSAPVQPGRKLEIHVGENTAGQGLANRRHMIPARIVWIDRSSDRATGHLVAGVEFLSSIAAQVDAA